MPRAPAPSPTAARAHGRRPIDTRRERSHGSPRVKRTAAAPRRLRCVPRRPPDGRRRRRRRDPPHHQKTGKAAATPGDASDRPQPDHQPVQAQGDSVTYEESPRSHHRRRHRRGPRGVRRSQGPPQARRRDRGLRGMPRQDPRELVVLWPTAERQGAADRCMRARGASDPTPRTTGDSATRRSRSSGFATSSRSASEAARRRCSRTCLPRAAP